MKKTLLSFAFPVAVAFNFQLLTFNCTAQVVIAAQDFELVPAPPVWNFSDYQGTSTYLDSLSLATESPASSPFGEDTTRAWETNQQSSGVIIEFDDVDISAYTNVYITYRVAAFSVGTSTNGPDALDYVIPYVSVDGGATWYQRKRITGNSNNSWEYTATAVAIDTFAAANTTVAFSPSGPGLRTTDGYSTAIIYIPNGNTHVKLRIDSRESTAQERWCIDNVELRGSPPGCSVSVSSVSAITCHGDCNGAAVATHSGIPPFSYLWTPTGQTNQTATGLCAGTYTCTARDAGGCTATGFITITEPDSLIANATVLNNVLCNGGSTGCAYVATSGGTSPYSYVWIVTGQIGDTACNLPPGCYTVSVTDANGCTAMETVCITEPPALVVNLCSQTNVSCNGGNDGSSIMCVNGGVPGYTYDWTPSAASGPTASFMPAGCYTLSVMDNNGCQDTGVVCITQPPPLNAVVCVQTNELCFGDSNACVTVCVGGGTPAYIYLWTNGAIDSTLCGLFPGNYSVTVYDANGCTATTSAVVTEPSQISVSLSVNDASCSSCCDGFAKVDSVTGGVGGYTYYWTPGGSTADSIGALCAGIYTCCVTDLNGCSICISDSVSFTTSVNEISHTAFSIHPNPFSNEIVVLSDINREAVITLYDYTGKIILFQKTTTAGTSINTEGIAAGMYFLRVENGGGVRNYKVVKE
jgi:hypothetical protein